jgi:threonine dehydrogenase-like Zn-dependent dehydrogenase
VLPTAYNAVKDTAVYPNDQVAIFGAGPIGQMAGVFAIGEGASKIIYVDTEPRLSAIASRWPAEHKDKLELVDFKKLSFGVTNKETVVSKLKEMCGGRGPDVAIECAAGEYAKGWMHWLEMSLGAETDTSEILNEMVEGVRNYGRAGITGVYVGYVSQEWPVMTSIRHVLILLPDQPFQCRLVDAARHPSYRQRPSTRHEVLGGVAEQNPGWRAGPYPDDLAPLQPRRYRQGLLQI